MKSFNQRLTFKGLLSDLRQFLTIENPLKRMKNTFNFMLKALFILEIFTFFSDILVMQENVLIRGLWLISKSMTSQNGQQIIKAHILPNISRRKGNQTIKFGQLIKYSIKYSEGKIFVQNSCRKWGRETSSRPLFVFEKIFI